MDICEYQVYRVIAGEAAKVLRGQTDTEEAVAAIKQKLSVYMAE